MLVKTIDLIDNIVLAEFKDDYDIYQFEKELLIKSVNNHDGREYLNQFSGTIAEIPPYLACVISLLTLVFQVHKYKADSRKDVKLDINKLIEIQMKKTK